MRTRIWIVCIVMALALWLVGCTPTILVDVPLEMVGKWQGQATVIVAWVDQETLSVALTIHEDGTVEGRVGDATLTGGSICNNPVGSEYIIMANLDGPIVAAEDVHLCEFLPYLWLYSGQVQSGCIHAPGLEYNYRTDQYRSCPDDSVCVYS